MTRPLLCLLCIGLIKLALGCTQFDEGEYSCTWKEESTGEVVSMKMYISNEYDDSYDGSPNMSFYLDFEGCPTSNPNGLGTPATMRVNGNTIRFFNGGGSCDDIAFFSNNDDTDIINTATIPASCDAFAGDDYSSDSGTLRGYLDCNLSKAEDISVNSYYTPSEFGSNESSNNSPSSNGSSNESPSSNKSPSSNGSSNNSSDSSFIHTSFGVFLLCLAVCCLF